MASDVLAHRVSREKADRWAAALVRKSDEDLLDFSPISERETIWRSLMLIFGCDLKSSPDQYLHSDDNLRELFEGAKMVSKETE
jgi:hypothetical protein